MTTPEPEDDLTAAPSESPGPDRQGKPRPFKEVVTSGAFLAGLLGWYAVNGPLWLLVKDPNLLCSTFPLNVLLLLLLALVKRTRLIALGMLTALAINMVVSVILGLSDNATCFVPFFTSIRYPSH